ncbi:uncharacterized protein LOC112345637 [Selaginella moellendorffii]|uniref:uncharacterized protein LOC112345637 n=1 Tax=Selaginella moellendorffii TaxID=88036 RepID=UPI000D1CC04B|nr:uncharacterized protein LOC112345637 [Selaginella moellendorffii]|eukprot:XP_024528591.1 uncharacterized protein LOC112345637 [Selaginella moellendorffii]
MSGLCPGVSNIMAAELVRMAQENASKPEELKFSYFIAGSGGAGPTVLATSLLLLNQNVSVYSQGKLLKLKPYTDETKVDFGDGVGKRSVFCINLPEVTTAHEILNIPNVTAKFGTAPFFWNWLMSQIAGMEFLEDYSKVESFARLSDPAVRAIDVLVGGKVSMRVDLDCKDGTRSTGLYTHPDLSVCAGAATAAFVVPILQGKTLPGVWFPEQREGIPIECREGLLEKASTGTSRYAMIVSYYHLH